MERMGKLIGESNLSSIESGKAKKRANFTLFLLAYILGKTSPNNKIKKVTTITSNINFNSGEAIDVNKFLPINENKITTPILIKLFATSKVASNFFGF